MSQIRFLAALAILLGVCFSSSTAHAQSEEEEFAACEARRAEGSLEICVIPGEAGVNIIDPRDVYDPEAERMMHFYACVSNFQFMVGWDMAIYVCLGFTHPHLFSYDGFVYYGDGGS